MPDPKVSIIIEAHDKASKEAKQVETALVNMAKSAEEPSAKVTKGVEKTTTALGMSRREWMRTGNEAAFYLTTIAGKSGEAGKALASLTGMATQLGESFMFGGGVGIGIAAAGIAISAVADAIQKQKEMQEAAIKPSQDLDREILNLTKSHDALGVAIAAVFNLTGKEADIIAKAAASYGDLRAQSTQVAAQKEHLAALTREYTAVTAELKQAQDLQVETGNDLSSQIAKLTARQAELLTLMRAAGTTYTNLSNATLNNAKALNEQDRIVNLLKSNVPQMARAWENYQDQLKSLAQTHVDAAAKIAKQIPEAEAKAAKDRAKIAADAEENIAKIKQDGADRVAKIYADLNERLNDLDAQYAKAAKERAYDYANTIKELDRDIAQAKIDNAKAAAKIEQDLADDLKDIETDSLEDEMSARTWSEVQRIRREKAQRIAEAQAKATEAKKELSDKKARDDAEFQHKRDLIDQEYNHQKTLAEQELIEAKQRAKSDADEQIAETRRATNESIAQAEKNRDKQIAAINERAAEELKAIRERAAEEEAAYNRAKAAALENYNSSMAALKDTRTETQRLRDDWLLVENQIDAATRSLIVQSKVLAAMGLLNPLSGTWQDWKKAGWYQTKPGEYKTVPGSPNKAVPVIAHGGEVFGRPPFGAGGNTVVKVFIDGREFRGMIREEQYQHDGM